MSLKICLVLSLLLAGVANAQDVPISKHVWVLTEENHSFEDVVGNSQMPYYNQLIKKYGLATQFYSDQHSSLPALMWYVAGAAVETNNDTVSCDHSSDNIVRELLKQPATLGDRIKRTCPLPATKDSMAAQTMSTLADTIHSSISLMYVREQARTRTVFLIRKWQRISISGNVANYAYITPDLNDDAHNGTLRQQINGFRQIFRRFLPGQNSSPVATAFYSLFGMKAL